MTRRINAETKNPLLDFDTKKTVVVGMCEECSQPRLHGRYLPRDEWPDSADEEHCAPVVQEPPMTEHNETQTEMWLRSSNAELSRQLATAIASEERALAVGDTIVAQFCHGYPYREEHEGSDDGATVFDARGEVFAKMSSLSDAQTLVSIINDACSRAYVCPNGGPTVEPWITHSTCPLCQK